MCGRHTTPMQSLLYVEFSIWWRAARLTVRCQDASNKRCIDILIMLCFTHHFSFCALFLQMLYFVFDVMIFKLEVKRCKYYTSDGSYRLINDRSNGRSVRRRSEFESLDFSKIPTVLQNTSQSSN